MSRTLLASQPGSWARGISIIWEFVRNAGSEAPLQTCWTGICILTTFPGDSQHTLRTASHRPWCFSLSSNIYGGNSFSQDPCLSSPHKEQWVSSSTGFARLEYLCDCLEPGWPLHPRGRHVEYALGLNRTGGAAIKGCHLRKCLGPLISFSSLASNLWPWDFSWG